METKQEEKILGYLIHGKNTLLNCYSASLFKTIAEARRHADDYLDRYAIYEYRENFNHTDAGRCDNHRAAGECRRCVVVG